MSTVTQTQSGHFVTKTSNFIMPACRWYIAPDSTIVATSNYQQELTTGLLVKMNNNTGLYRSQDPRHLGNKDARHHINLLPIPLRSRI